MSNNKWKNNIRSYGIINEEEEKSVCVCAQMEEKTYNHPLRRVRTNMSAK